MYVSLAKILHRAPCTHCGWLSAVHLLPLNPPLRLELEEDEEDFADVPEDVPDAPLLPPADAERTVVVPLRAPLLRVLPKEEFRTVELPEALLLDDDKREALTCPPVPDFPELLVLPDDNAPLPLLTLDEPEDDD